MHCRGELEKWLYAIPNTIYTCGYSLPSATTTDLTEYSPTNDYFRVYNFGGQAPVLSPVGPENVTGPNLCGDVKFHVTIVCKKIPPL